MPVKNQQKIGMDDRPSQFSRLNEPRRNPMCETATLDRIARAVKDLPEPLAAKVLDYIEDLVDIAEANARLADPKPAIPMEDVIREFHLDD